MSQKDIKFMIQYVEAHGFQFVRHTRHYIFSKGPHTLTVSGTPGDSHTIHNIRRELRKMGITPLPDKVA